MATNAIFLPKNINSLRRNNFSETIKFLYPKTNKSNEE